VDEKFAPVNMGPWHFVRRQIFIEYTIFNEIIFVKAKNANVKRS